MKVVQTLPACFSISCETMPSRQRRFIFSAIYSKPGSATTTPAATLAADLGRMQPRKLPIDLRLADLGLAEARPRLGQREPEINLAIVGPRRGGELVHRHGPELPWNAIEDAVECIKIV